MNLITLLAIAAGVSLAAFLITHRIVSLQKRRERREQARQERDRAERLEQVRYIRESHGGDEAA